MSEDIWRVRNSNDNDDEMERKEDINVFCAVIISDYHIVLNVSIYCCYRTLCCRVTWLVQQKLATVH